MKFIELLRQILRANPDGVTPQQIRDIIKEQHPEFYGTESHQRNVEKGNYNDLDHALLAQIYVVSRSASDIYADKSQKPMHLSLLSVEGQESDDIGQELDTENLLKLEEGIGTLYVLGTNLYTKEGEEIIKIGITTGSVENRISQLYTTGVPYRFRVISQYETKNYSELEQSLHRLLDPYRINRSREFFTEKALEYIEKVIEIHDDILAKA